MQRIIYLCDEYGYCVADVKYKHELPRKIATLVAHDVQVICVFEVESRKASFLCRSFDLHLQLLKASYPGNLLRRIFNKMSLKKQPDYTMLSKLIRPDEQSPESIGTIAHSA